jgi:hypothetical protein
MHALSVQPLEPKSPWLAQIAADQFAYWGPLTSYSSRNLYDSFLEEAVRSLRSAQSADRDYPRCPDGLGELASE